HRRPQPPCRTDDEKSVERAEQALVDLDIGNAAVIVGDPAKGAAKQGPFDAIVIAGVVEHAPRALLQQLKDGGKLGALLKEDGVTRGVVYHRSGDDFVETRHFNAASARVIRGFEKEKTFVF
ncbi:MAG: protein-L-isoaspartate O-methyltransferase, partial [Pseudomonadota bacterium]